MNTNFTHTTHLIAHNASAKALPAFVSCILALLILTGCGGGSGNGSELAQVETGRYMLLQHGERDTATISKGDGRSLAIDVSELDLGLDIESGDCDPISTTCTSWTITPTINATIGGYRIGVSDISAATPNTLRADDYINVSVLPATVAPAGKLINMTLNTPPNNNMMSAGYGHNLLIASDGSLWGWGHHEYGKLGSNRIAAKQRDPVPAPVRNLNNITQVSAGNTHSLVVTTDGTVLAFGNNAFGQLGDSTTIDRYFPTAVVGLSNVNHVSAGDSHSLALVNNISGNQVYAWGFNEYGQLGIGKSIPRPYSNLKLEDAPVLVPINNIVQVAAGSQYSLALDTSGEVWYWGKFGENIIYTPTKLNGLTDVVRLVTGNGNGGLLLTSNGTVWFLGYNQSVLFPTQVSGLTNIIDIAAGSSFGMALNASGQVFTWGDSSEGQLGRAGDAKLPGLVTLNAPAIDIEAGGNQAFAMVADCSAGVTLRSWGSNDLGQLGDGTFSDKHLPSIVIGIGEQDSSCDRRVLFYKTGLNPAYATVQGNNMICNGDLCWEMVDTTVTTQLPVSIQYSGLETGYGSLNWDCQGYDGSSSQTFNLPVTDDVYCKLINQTVPESGSNNNSANSSEYTLTVIIQGGPGAGEVNSNEIPLPQFQCINSSEATTTCSTTYTAGAAVALIGSAYGSANLSWSGCTPGYEAIYERPACLLTMDSDRTVTATFSPL